MYLLEIINTCFVVCASLSTPVLSNLSGRGPTQSWIESFSRTRLNSTSIRLKTSIQFLDWSLTTIYYNPRNLECTWFKQYSGTS